jgi:hypothetical protein
VSLGSRRRPIQDHPQAPLCLLPNIPRSVVPFRDVAADPKGRVRRFVIVQCGEFDHLALCDFDGVSVHALSPAASASIASIISALWHSLG